MNVTYTPSLREQIKRRASDAIELSERPVVVRVAGRYFVERVDPQTHRCTGEPQQFRKSGSTMTILKKGDWVAEPTIINVDWGSFG